ncbi:hypothetical protein CDJ58_07075 [Campylobacter lari]|nr:hypothetical protein [Campylobacter lari]EAK5749151.1 hypothetical protein [Campylobacter lari]EAK9878346.1 hypothetical protein [Campylobacter lari]
MKKFFFILLNILFFIGCSSKVQTNDIPNEKKYFLPKNNSNSEVKIDSNVLIDYDKTLEIFFNVKKNEEEKKDIYKTGMRYFK